jgi:hypothetical protein
MHHFVVERDRRLNISTFSSFSGHEASSLPAQSRLPSVHALVPAVGILERGLQQSCHTAWEKPCSNNSTVDHPGCFLNEAGAERIGNSFSAGCVVRFRGSVSTIRSTS